MRTSEQIQADILTTFGFLPPFFVPAQSTPQIFENLWQQTLSAYLNNPLPTLFKEKLSAYLSRFCVVPYCMICHSCSLHALGLQGHEVLALLELPLPTEQEVDQHLNRLKARSVDLNDLSTLGGDLEASLLACAIFIALSSDIGYYHMELRQLLGVVSYQYLIAFIAYVKTCHVWIAAHPEINYEADQRVREHFEALVQEVPALADFFAHYWERVKRDRQTWAEQQAELAERKRHEATLRQMAEQNRYLAQAIASTSEGVLITDPHQPDNPIIYCNPAFSRITGYPPNEVIGHNSCFLQGPGTDPQVVAEIRQAIQEQRSIRATLLNYRKDGQPFWNELKIAPVFSEQGELLYCVGIQTDISERKQAEEALRKSQERFYRIAQATNDAVWEWDLQTEAVWWNEGVQTLFGYAAEEVTPTIAWWYAQIHPHDRDSVMAEIQATLNSSKSAWSDEYRYRRANGDYAYVYARGYVIRDAAGTACQMIGGMTDITEKQQLEAQLLRAQRLESIGTLASGIAHDLNNVLTPILASAQLLLLNQMPEQKRQLLLETIESSTKRGAALIRQVLSFARGVEGKRRLLQLQPLLTETQQIVQETFPKSIEVQLDLDNRLWLVNGDTTQLHQILMNLCVNARDAMPQGGTLRLSARNIWIDQHYARMNLEAHVGPHVVITVADSGTGISPAVLDRMFEPFFTTKEPGKGTGLGLSTVLGIVKSHNGFIEVTSTPGEGSQFKVFLPTATAHELPQTQTEELMVGQGEVILVVDDEASIREVNQASLEAYHYRVLTAADGIDAIALYAIHRQEISLVLVDLMMPAMDGFTTIRTLRKLDPQVKIVAVSGLAPAPQSFNDIHSEVQAFLPKPYTARELVRSISTVLQKPLPLEVNAADHSAVDL